MVDCREKVRNKFEFIALAAQRVKDINNGAPVTINRKNSKNTVIALKEIQDEKVCIIELRQRLINDIQSYNSSFYNKVDIIEDDEDIYAENENEVDLIENNYMAPISKEESYLEENIDFSEAFDDIL